MTDLCIQCGQARYAQIFCRHHYELKKRRLEKARLQRIEQAEREWEEQRHIPPAPPLPDDLYHLEPLPVRTIDPRTIRRGRSLLFYRER